MASRAKHECQAETKGHEISSRNRCAELAVGRRRATYLVAFDRRALRLAKRAPRRRAPGVRRASEATTRSEPRMCLAAPSSLTSRGLLSKLTDVLFIRRALNGSLDRTLNRFAAEAAAESDD